jgi:hypothetical protein
MRRSVRAALFAEVDESAVWVTLKTMSHLAGNHVDAALVHHAIPLVVDGFSGATLVRPVARASA